MPPDICFTCGQPATLTYSPCIPRELLPPHLQFLHPNPPVAHQAEKKRGRGKGRHEDPRLYPSVLSKDGPSPSLDVPSGQQQSPVPSSYLAPTVRESAYRGVPHGHILAPIAPMHRLAPQHPIAPTNWLAPQPPQQPTHSFPSSQVSVPPHSSSEESDDVV